MSSNYALTFFFLAGIAACGAGQAPPEAPASRPDGSASAEVDRTSSECKFVIAGDRCFVTQSAACAAAGCDAATCLSAETFPAQVSCKK